MNNNCLHDLQNGSDIRGIVLTNEDQVINLTNKEIKIITIAFHEWLKNKNKLNNLKISVGIDSRITGNEFKHTIINTLVACKVTVYDCKLSTTPSIYMTTIMDDYKCDGAIMITASHLPYYYNGIKLFTKYGCLDKEEIQEVLDIASKYEDNKEYVFVSEMEARRMTVFKPLIDDYSKLLVEKIRKEINSLENYEKPLTGIKIILDAGNGSGGFFKEKVLEKLGADTTGSQFIEPDGTFPNHIPNPEADISMNLISNAVIDNNADLGIIFDTDVDRVALVGREGRFINRSSLIALVSAMVLKEHKGSTIVTDSVTSDGVGKFIKKLGGKHYKVKKGYKNIITQAMNINNKNEECYAAIETSGHVALKENYFLDDAAYFASKVLITMAKLKKEGKCIEDLIIDLELPNEEREIRLAINEKDFNDYANKILYDLVKLISNDENMKIDEDNCDGIKVIFNEKFGEGWFTIRLSLHEPKIVINIESNKTSECEKILEFIKNFINNYNVSYLN
ncbi:phosphomannomutase/phosphoglucomutase [Clostridium botulinum]|uniref:Phosphomannomutase/phosphoglucomutase n=1 Tax=Clostridium botulinum TaxID=1491 RepID=A0A6B4JPU7_CLOBO|nr:phosphoglucomutase [Clostridium botulinum]EES51261.1 phosphoglucomutase/phosphomannomutase family protein [Clostridium botulinum E1 str. 'BoNT E Beluga']MBY6762575.1 phosphomannomutase/phosphoglucomutase [Clostridium botulinum]MBY6920976.1 phosphomannomutase/phosphoglucomutase [Clostridium botulinum]MCR1132683.1 phosphomannomutase/phosphoglucomutase [Clostridium botulinum]NFJ58974.1 phosphomannomutase/phosphoglucomutase [Clostridium botulinum]